MRAGIGGRKPPGFCPRASDRTGRKTNQNFVDKSNCQAYTRERKASRAGVTRPPKQTVPVPAALSFQGVRVRALIAFVQRRAAGLCRAQSGRFPDQRGSRLAGSPWLPRTAESRHRNSLTEPRCVPSLLDLSRSFCANALGGRSQEVGAR